MLFSFSLRKTLIMAPGIHSISFKGHVDAHIPENWLEISFSRPMAQLLFSAYRAVIFFLTSVAQ